MRSLLQKPPLQAA